MKQFNPETHSLTDFIRLQGGIDVRNEYLKGECRAYFNIKEGYNLLNNKTGATLDYLVEACIEAGFLFFDATTTDLLDNLRKDVYSKKLTGKGCCYSFAKQDWKEDYVDLEEIFYKALYDNEILELTEELDEGLDLMPVEIFNLYYGGVNHVS